MSISVEVEKHGKNKGELERNGLEQIAQELMQVTVVEEDSGRCTPSGGRGAGQRRKA